MTMSDEEMRERIIVAINGKKPRWYRPRARRQWKKFHVAVSIPAESLRDVTEEHFRTVVIPLYNDMAKRLNDLYIKPYMESQNLMTLDFVEQIKIASMFSETLMRQCKYVHTMHHDGVHVRECTTTSCSQVERSLSDTEEHLIVWSDRYAKGVTPVNNTLNASA
jgi:hypothetical protein